MDGAVRELLAPPAGAVADCRRRLAALEAGKQSSDARLELALKFVDWFSDRGDAYEHNLAAIDHRLDGLVRKDTINEPFSAQVRIV